MKKCFTIMLCAALLLCAFSAAGEEAPDAISILMEFSGMDLEPYRGKAIFLNIFANYCSPCMSEMPVIDALSREYGDRAAFLLVNTEPDPAKNDVMREKFGLEAAHLFMDSEVNISWVLDILAGGQGLIPVTLVIDRNAVPIYLGYGSLPEEAMRELMELALNPAEENR